MDSDKPAELQSSGNVRILGRPLLWKEPALTARGAGDTAVVLPVGTVTLLLSDVEGSVRLWEADREAMTAAVARLDALITDAVGRHAGVRPVEQGGKAIASSPPSRAPLTRWRAPSPSSSPWPTSPGPAG